MSPEERIRTVAVLLVFAFTFSILTVGSYRQESATADESQHLVAGYAALNRGDFRVDTTHPPFLRMWAALPLSMMTNVWFAPHASHWDDVERMAFSREFMYEKNDGDPLLYRARFMTVLLGILLGLFLFWWARELYGFWPAVVVLGLYATEPNILAHAGLVTTDLGITCFLFGAFYFLKRACRELTWKNVFLLATLVALAQVSKFSALTFWPLGFTLLMIRGLRHGSWRCRIGSRSELGSRTSKMVAACSILGALLVASFLAIWASYGLRYAPVSGDGNLSNEPIQSATIDSDSRWTEILRWIDQHRFLPRAYTQGLALCRGLAQQRLTYLAGRTSYAGWWYYFPVAFCIKTPIALLLLFGGGLALIVRRRAEFLNDNLFILLPPAMYLAFTMTANLNIGLRHILPIVPFVLLIAGRAVQALAKPRPRALRAALVVLCLFQVDEVAFVHPHYLAFFNQLIGGPQHGYQYLADSNLDWGQDLKGLKKWMDKHGVDSINLSYFGIADPAYYGIHCSHLYPSLFVAAGQDTNLHLPGYVAVSVQNLLGLSVNPPRPEVYRKLLESEPVAVIGYSIRVYWVDRPWW